MCLMIFSKTGWSLSWFSDDDAPSVGVVPVFDFIEIFVGKFKVSAKILEIVMEGFGWLDMFWVITFERDVCYHKNEGV